MLSLIRILCIMLVFYSCEQATQSIDYTIGRDPTWYPLNFGEKNAPINAFINSLVAAIGKVENIPLQIVDVDWVELSRGFENEVYPAIFTSQSPNLESLNQYTFSDPFLLLGPVLIVRINSDAHSLEELDQKTVGISPFDNTVFVVQKYPSIVIQPYDNMPMALDDLANGKIDAVLLSTIEAHAFVTNVYPDQLKIVTPPLNDKGLRLIVLKEKHKALIKHFNDGLRKLQESGVYRQLRDFYQI